jgi:hypothetical protein
VPGKHIGKPTATFPGNTADISAKRPSGLSGAFCWFNFTYAIGLPRKGFDHTKDVGIIGHWLWQFPIEPDNVMVMVTQDKSPEELQPEEIYRDTPKHVDDALALIVDLKKKRACLHLGKNKTRLFPAGITDEIESVMHRRLAEGLVLPGIQAALKALHNNYQKDPQN